MKAIWDHTIVYNKKETEAISNRGRRLGHRSVRDAVMDEGTVQGVNCNTQERERDVVAHMATSEVVCGADECSVREGAVAR
jgi:hypothetical protein